MVDFKKTAKALALKSLEKMSREYADNDAMIKEWEARQKEMKAEMVETAKRLDASSVDLGEGVEVVFMQTHSPSRLSSTRLVELGVDPDLITEATVLGTPYTQVKVVRKKEGGK